MNRRLHRTPCPLGSEGSAARSGRQKAVSVPIPESELRTFGERLAGLTQPVKIDYFHQSVSALMVPGRRPCPTCNETQQVLEQIADLHDAIRLTVYDLAEEPDRAHRRGIPAAPGIVVRGEINRPLRIIGMPGGYFLAVLLQALLNCSSPPKKPPSEITQALKRLRAPITVRVLGSIMHAPSADAAMSAFSLALVSPRVEATLFSLEEFSDMAEQTGVRRIPATLVANTIGFSGVCTPLELAQLLVTAQTHPEKAEAAVPQVQPGSSVPWQPPTPAQSAQAGPSSPPGESGGGAPTPQVPPGMRRTSSGLIIPGS